MSGSMREMICRREQLAREADELDREISRAREGERDEWDARLRELETGLRDVAVFRALAVTETRRKNIRQLRIGDHVTVDLGEDEPDCRRCLVVRAGPVTADFGSDALPSRGVFLALVGGFLELEEPG